jgi:hypothetical protein
MGLLNLCKRLRASALAHFRLDAIDSREPGMLAKGVLILVLLVPILILTFSPLTNAQSTWLTEGAYMTYEQVFVWSGHQQTESMTWLVTGLEAEDISLNVTSYTIDEALNVIPVSSVFTINSNTREVVSSSETAMIRQKWPFWVETDVGIGSQVDTWFGVTTIGGSETVSILGQERSAWVVEYNWAYNTYMKRWYDKATSIALKIRVGLLRAGTPVEVTETAILTNINLPPSVPDDGGFTPWTLLLATAFGLATISVGIFIALRLKRRQQTRKTSVN